MPPASDLRMQCATEMQARATASQSANDRAGAHSETKSPTCAHSFDANRSSFVRLDSNASTRYQAATRTTGLI